MDATRRRLSFAGDWLTAGALLAATVIVAALVVREMRGAPRAVDSLPDAAASAGVPADAVPVPSLTLGSSEIKVGDSMADAISRLAAAAQAPEIVRQATERGPLGAREIRWYRLSGTGFILVFEPFERRGEPRLAAIYLI